MTIREFRGVESRGAAFFFAVLMGPVGEVVDDEGLEK